MFADDDSPFRGIYIDAQRPINRPQPLSRPRPVIMVAAVARRRTLRLVAQYADACNVFFGFEGTVQEQAAVPAHKFEVLRRHCEEVGRPYGDIRRTVLPRSPWLPACRPPTFSPSAGLPPTSVSRT